MIISDLVTATVGSSQVDKIYLGETSVFTNNASRNLVLSSSNPTPASGKFKMLPTGVGVTINTIPYGVDPALAGFDVYSLEHTTTTAARLCLPAGYIFPAGTMYTLSVHVRRFTSYPPVFTNFRLGYIVSGVNYFAEFYVGNSTQYGASSSYVNSTTFQSGSDTAGITDFYSPAFWSRASITFTPPTTIVPSEIYILRKPFTAQVGDSIYYFGPQLETGPLTDYRAT